jgi:DNA (cytosine-5)-methyltransferase 1
VLTVGSLFSGVGGFDLGFERTGHMRTVWFCEQDPFCQRVLAKHWPGVPCYPDVRALVGHADSAPAHAHAASGGSRAAVGESGVRPDVPVPVPYVDILCGGFPCQDISVAGRGEGIDAARSGLWAEYARLIRDLRPRYVVVENVAALLARGMERVLGDLAACGYDAEWDCIPASAVGAPHRRDRVWLVAYPQQVGPRGLTDAAGGHNSDGPATGREEGPGRAAERREDVAHAAVGGGQRRRADAGFSEPLPSDSRIWSRR